MHGRQLSNMAAARVMALVGLGTLCILAGACGSSRPETRVTPAEVASPVRGTEDAADSVPDQTRRDVYRSLLRDFYRPTAGQARWIDPRPLGEKRGVSDSAIRAMSDDEMPPDAGWAALVVEASGMERVCVLGGAEDSCAGRKGGVLRLSPVYAAGPEQVHVYVRYTPHGGAAGPVTEQRFTLVRRDEYWRIRDHFDVPTP